MNMSVGVNGLARKVNRVYVGIDGVARKVKKAYVGVDNIAKLVYREKGIIEKITGIANLTKARAYIGCCSVGNYAVFAGGCIDANYDGENIVEAYDASLTRFIPTPLSNNLSGITGCSVGNYAVFAGGYRSSAWKFVNAYDVSLTRSIPAELTSPRSYPGGGSVGNYAVFAGGLRNPYNSSSGSQTTVDAYNVSLTRSTATGLSMSRCQLGGGSVGNYAVFAGGSNGIFDSSFGVHVIYNTVDAYNVCIRQIKR